MRFQYLMQVDLMKKEKKLELKMPLELSIVSFITNSLVDVTANKELVLHTKTKNIITKIFFINVKVYSKF